MKKIFFALYLITLSLTAVKSYATESASDHITAKSAVNAAGAASINAAGAASINAAGAAALKKEISDFLSWQTRISGYTGQGLEAGSDISVVPKNSTYEVRVPDVGLILASGYKVQIGTVVFNFKPAPNNDWLLSMAIPKKFAVLDAARTPAFDVSIGKQVFSARWSAKLDMFPKIDLTYENIKLSPKNPLGVSAEIATVKNILNLDEGADGLWSGSHDFDISDIKITFNEPRKINLKVGGTKSQMTYEKMRLDSAEILRKAITDLTEGAQPPLSEKAVREEIRKTLENMIKNPLNIRGASESSNLFLSIDPPVAPSGEKLGQPLLVSLDKISSSISMTGIEAEKTSVEAKTKLDKFNISGLPASFLGIIPTEANFEISLQNFPSKEAFSLYDLIKKASAEKQTRPERNISKETADEVNARIATIPQILSGAQTTLSINNSYIHAPDVGADFDSSLVANSASPIGIAGHVTLALSGLDEIIKKQSPQARSERLVAKYLATISALQAMGKLELGPNGKPLRKYKFDFTTDGKMLLNGIDVTTISKLVGGGLATPPAADSPAAPVKTPAPSAPPTSPAAP